MATFILSVVAGLIDALHELELPSITGACVAKKEALKRARKSFSYAYASTFKNPVGPLKQLIDYVRGKMEARIGCDALQMQSQDLLKDRATRAGVSNLDKVIDEASPLLFLVAIIVAGWFDELVDTPPAEVSAGSESAWVQGEVAVDKWLDHSRNRDLVPWRMRRDVGKEQMEKDISNFLKRFRRVAVWGHESHEEIARRWLKYISTEYVNNLGMDHVVNYSNGGGSGGGSGGSGGGRAVGVSMNVAVGDR
jgi:hypothetical protein